MKKHLFYCLLALPLMMFTSCGSDDDGDEPKNVDETVVVKDDGTTNNGSIFSAIDDKNFFLDYIKYTVEEGHLTVSGYDKVEFKGIAKIVSKITYKGNTYEVLSIKGQPYSSDEPGAFGLCKILTSVNIPSSVTIIEDRAFMGCSSLTEVNIPNSVTTIGCTVFYNCI